jgi:hypothetical protein
LTRSLAPHVRSKSSLFTCSLRLPASLAQEEKVAHALARFSYTLRSRKRRRLRTHALAHSLLVPASLAQNEEVAPALARLSRPLRSRILTGSPARLSRLPARPPARPPLPPARWRAAVAGLLLRLRRWRGRTLRLMILSLVHSLMEIFRSVGMAACVNLATVRITAYPERYLREWTGAGLMRSALNSRADSTSSLRRFVASSLSRRTSRC